MKYSLLLVAGLCLLSCQRVYRHKKTDHKEGKLQQLSWMLGKWQMQTPDGVIVEEWQQPADSEWHGTSYVVSQAGDTPFREHIRLSYKNDSLVYKPTVAGQDEVPFPEKAMADDEVIFENLRHDFPQRIIYKRTSDSTIVATIEGLENGQMRKEEFSYVRTQ